MFAMIPDGVSLRLYEFDDGLRSFGERGGRHSYSLRGKANFQMALNAAQQQKAQTWVNSKHALGQCPACHTTGWSFGEIVIGANFTPGGGMQLGGGGVPMLQVVCNNCAYIAMFAAVPMGLAN